jgi:hypothetical protein
MNPSAVPLTRSSAASKWALICGLLVIVAVLACHAWVEIGYIDDWSTARRAQLFAQSGHFIYNGWLRAPEGWQIVWAAPFIKLFGFSYAVVRFSLLPIVFATVYLFQRCLVSFGLTEKNASFGALSLGLSPIFVPVASSYMSDIPSLFCGDFLPFPLSEIRDSDDEQKHIYLADRRSALQPCFRHGPADRVARRAGQWFSVVGYAFAGGEALLYWRSH